MKSKQYGVISRRYNYAYGSKGWAKKLKHRDFRRYSKSLIKKAGEWE